MLEDNYTEKVGISPANTIFSHKFYKKYLKVTAIVVGSFGPVFALGANYSTSGFAAWSLDLLSWPIDGKQTFVDSTTRFLSALTGGFLLGWGVLIWFLSTMVYDTAPDQVRKCIVISLLSWFFLDSTGSILSGNPSNVIFNIIVLIIAIGTLWVTAKN